MAELTDYGTISVESLALYQMIEGLVHNLNTPLNLIMGYAQQLKKKYPEINQLDKIYDASVQMNDLLQTTMDHLLLKIMDVDIKLDLGKWIQDEILYLKNNLKIKRNITFNYQPPDIEINIKANPLILSLFFDSLVAHILRISVNVQNPCLNLSVALKEHYAVLSVNNHELFSDFQNTIIYLQKVSEALVKLSISGKTESSLRWEIEQDKLLIIFSEFGVDSAN